MAASGLRPLDAMLKQMSSFVLNDRTQAASTANTGVVMLARLSFLLPAIMVSTIADRSRHREVTGGDPNARLMHKAIGRRAVHIRLGEAACWGSVPGLAGKSLVE